MFGLLLTAIVYFLNSGEVANSERRHVLPVEHQGPPIFIPGIPPPINSTTITQILPGETLYTASKSSDAVERRVTPDNRFNPTRHVSSWGRLPESTVIPPGLEFDVTYSIGGRAPTYKNAVETAVDNDALADTPIAKSVQYLPYLRRSISVDNINSSGIDNQPFKNSKKRTYPHISLPLMTINYEEQDPEIYIEALNGHFEDWSDYYGGLSDEDIKEYLEEERRSMPEYTEQLPGTEET